MDKKPMFDTICLSGGGFKGFAILGVLEYLENNSFLRIDEISNWVGTSAGSILSFFFTLGYKIQEIRDFILDFNFNKLEPVIDIEFLLEKYGIDDGSKLMLIVTNFLKEKYSLTDITFKEHYNLTKRRLNIVGTNFSKSSEILFNFETTPELSVLTAIRISSSIPFIFTPVLYNSEYYIDGAFVNNFPIKYCNPRTTLGVFTTNNCNNNLNDIFSLINGCLSIFVNTISEKDCKNYPYVIEINNTIQGISITNFNIPRETKLQIINMGQTFARKFIETINNPDNNSIICKQLTSDKETQTD